MRAWFHQHVQSFRTTWVRLAQSPLSSALNVLVIGVALALPLGAYALLINMQRIAGPLAAAPEMSVFMAADAAPADIAAVATALKAAPAAAKSRFVPRDQALAELKKAEGMGDILASLQSNPLPDAYVIELAGKDPLAAEALGRDLAKLPKVAHVQLDSAFIRRLDALLGLARIAVFVLASLLSVGLVAVTFNTIRLQILTLRDEIEVSKLIGATNAFIRRPFFYLGILQGGLGGVTALAILALAGWLMNVEIARLAATYGSDFHLQSLRWGDAASFLVFAAGLGWTGAYLSVSKHLWQIEPR
ncbi:MAG: permease-like cell division protein FtsX [Betaproteobacteria bacterium]